MVAVIQRRRRANDVHAYIISYALGWKCHSRMKHMFFILQSHRFEERIQQHLSPVLRCNTSTPRYVVEYMRGIYANAFQIDNCVRIIIFNGCRVSRLTVLFVLLISAGKNFIVPFHTCDLYDCQRADDREREREKVRASVSPSPHTNIFHTLYFAMRTCNEIHLIFIHIHTHANNFLA